MGLTWFLINIVLPAIFPIVGVTLLRITTPPLAPDATEETKQKYLALLKKFRLMNVMKDGQLGWIAAAIATSSLYDFLEIISKYLSHPGKQAEIQLVWFCVLLPIFFSIYLGIQSGAQGAISDTSLIDPPYASKSAWLKHYQIFVVSLFMTLMAGATWTFIHFVLTPVLEPAVKAVGGN